MAKVAFLQNIWYEQLGIMYLSAALKSNGHLTEIFIGTNNKTIAELRHYNPDIISLSIMNMQEIWLRETVKKLRIRGFTQPIVVGGPCPTFSPEEVINNKGVDMLCLGEGEDTMVELANAIDGKKDYSRINNLWVKKIN